MTGESSSLKLTHVDLTILKALCLMVSEMHLMTSDVIEQLPIRKSRCDSEDNFLTHCSTAIHLSNNSPGTFLKRQSACRNHVLHQDQKKYNAIMLVTPFLWPPLLEYDMLHSLCALMCIFLHGYFG